MNNIVLTLDYELFLGEKSGTVKNCMIRPMSRLMSLCQKYHSTMTIFWDVMHYQKIIENLGRYPELREDKLLIEAQIQALVKEGHDVQLHLHPHWLDAEYNSGQWSLSNIRYYKLQNLSDEKINHIVKTAKQTIENITKKEVFIFRAGGWCIEPFGKISQALQTNDIYLDSSIATEKYSDSKIADFDFRDYPRKNIYSFSTPKYEDKNGFFTEVQISTIKLANYLIFYDYLKRFIKKETITIFGDGIGIGSKNSYLKILSTILKRLLFGANDMLALEFNSEYLFKKTLTKVPDNSVMIGHPKSLGLKHFEVLETLLKQESIKFVSLDKVINE